MTVVLRSNFDAETVTAGFLEHLKKAEAASGAAEETQRKMVKSEPVFI